MTDYQDNYWSELSSNMVDRVIDNEYQLLEVLGHGAYGCLFLGQSMKDHSYVAVKVLSKAGLDPQQLQLQQLEIETQSLLKHPNLLALHRAIQDKDYIYMVMELCDQGDLFDFVIRDQQDNPIREAPLVKKLYLQILNGVEEMHAKGVYHRDLKLENILLKCEDEEDEDSLTCKVADFGLATRDRYSVEFGCGSASYLAPEHFDEGDVVELMPYDAAASDVWSLGILLIALMFGRNPWQEASSGDAAYNEFRRNPLMLKEQLFPELSHAAYKFLTSVLCPIGSDRPSVSELKEKFMSLDNLYVDEEDEYEEDENVCSPVSIPALISSKDSDITSFDSAFFSGGTGGYSWSDLVDIDEDIPSEKDVDYCHSPDMSEYEEDDTMFIHRGEKESWWL